MITKDNFTHRYASTTEEPTKEEMEYVFNNLDEAEYELDMEHSGCCIYCVCPEDELEDINVSLFYLPIPFIVEGFTEERTLSIMVCKRCHQWACCD